MCTKRSSMVTATSFLQSLIRESSAIYVLRTLGSAIKSSTKPFLEAQDPKEGYSGVVDVVEVVVVAEAVDDEMMPDESW